MTAGRPRYGKAECVMPDFTSGRVFPPGEMPSVARLRTQQPGPPRRVAIPGSVLARIKRGALPGETLRDATLRYLNRALDEWGPE